MRKNVAVVIQNFIQYESIKSGIDELIKRKIEIDIFVPEIIGNEALQEMHDAVYQYIKNSGYSVKRKVKNKHNKYCVLLEPYDTSEYLKLEYEKRIMYKYSPVTAKPFFSYVPHRNIIYDAILTTSKFDKEMFSVFTNTYEIGSLKYTDFLKKKNKKETILYLPTYNTNETTTEIFKILEQLKKDYKIITKLHHRDEFMGKVVFNDGLFEHVFSSRTFLRDLLEETDFVISGNSGSVFEAMYLNVPVLIYAKDINENSINSIEPYQNDLIKNGTILYTNDPEEIPKLIKQTKQSKILKKQKSEAEKLFSKRKINDDYSSKLFANIIEKHLNNEHDQRRLKLRDYLFSSLNEEDQKYNELKIMIENLKTKSIEQQTIIDEYEKGKLYNLAQKIYIIKAKLFRREK